MNSKQEAYIWDKHWALVSRKASDPSVLGLTMPGAVHDGFPGVQAPKHHQEPENKAKVKAVSSVTSLPISLDLFHKFSPQPLAVTLETCGHGRAVQGAPPALRAVAARARV